MAYFNLYIDKTKDPRSSAVLSLDTVSPTNLNAFVLGDIIPIAVHILDGTTYAEEAGTGQIKVSLGQPGEVVYTYQDVFDVSASAFIGNLTTATQEAFSALAGESYIKCYLEVEYTYPSTSDRRTLCQQEIYFYNTVLSGSYSTTALPDYLTVSESDDRYVRKGEAPSGSFWILEGNNLYLSQSAWSVGIGTDTPTEQLHVTANALIDGTVKAGTYFTGSLIGDVTGTSSNAVSSSYAKSASYSQAGLYANAAAYATECSHSVYADFATDTIFCETASLSALAVTSSYALSASNAANSTSASYAWRADTLARTSYNISTSFASSSNNTVTASHALSAVSSSFALTASYSQNITNITNVQSSTSASWASSSLSSSVAVTASYSFVSVVSNTSTYASRSQWTVSSSFASSSISSSHSTYAVSAGSVATASYVAARRKVFDSINALATSTFVIENNEPVIVCGYYTVGDWGQERFAKYTSSTSETPNLGNVFTSSMGGRFIFDDRNEPVQNIKWWGAKGDGVTDDYTSISASLAFSNHLEVPVGRYNHSQPIVISTDEPISIKSKTGAYQSGYLAYSNIQEAEFVYVGSPVGAAWNITSTGIRYGNDLENIAINASGSALYGLLIGKSGRASLKNVRSNNATTANFYLSASQFCLFERCSTSKNDDLVTHSSSYGLLLDGFSPCNQFIDCQFENSNTYGVYLGFNSINNSFIGCAIESNNGGGLYISSSAVQNHFINTWFENNGDTSHDIDIANQCYFNTFENSYHNDHSASVAVSGSYNTFNGCRFGQFNIFASGSRNKVENCAWYYTASDASGFNDYRNFINAAASIRKDTISSTITVTGAVTASAGFHGRLQGSASYALTSSFIGAGTNNYLPKWNANRLTSTSSIYDNNTNVGIGTTSPTSKLHVLADDSLLKLVRSSLPTQYLEVTETANGHGIFGYSPNSNRKILTIGTSHSLDAGSTGAGYIYFNTSGSTKVWIDETGNLLPYVTATYDLGSPTRKWNNIYANNLVGTASLATSASYADTATVAGGVYNTDVQVFATNEMIISANTANINITSPTDIVMEAGNVVDINHLVSADADLTGNITNADVAISSSYAVTSSYSVLAENANNADFLDGYNSAEFQLALVTGNTYTITSSWANNATNAVTAAFWDSSSIVAKINTKQDTLVTGGTYSITSSWANNATNAISASHAVTANTAAFAADADLLDGYNSAEFQLSLPKSGNTYLITASWANTALNANDATHAVSADDALSATYATSAGQAATASYWDSSSIVTKINTKQDTLITGGNYAITASWASYAVSASYAPSSPSISASHALNADNAITAAYAADADLLDGYNSAEFQLSLPKIGNTYLITASWANNAVIANDADHATSADSAQSADYATSAGSAGTATSASYALSASYAPTSAVNNATILATRTMGYVSASVGNQGSFNSILGTVRTGLSNPIAAGTFGTGDVIRIKAMGTLTALDGYDFDVKLVIGGLSATYDINEQFSYNATNAVWDLEADVVIESEGSPATVVAVSHLNHFAQASVEAEYLYRQNGIFTGTLDTEATATIDLQFKPVDASLAKVMTCKSFTIQKI